MPLHFLLHLLPVSANEVGGGGKQHLVVDLDLKLSGCVFSFTEHSV